MTKSRDLRDTLRKSGADLMLLQETNLVAQRTGALKRQWVFAVYTSEYSTYSRGVCILIQKSLNFHFEGLTSDRMGRYLILQAKVWGTSYLMVNAYHPTPADIQLLNKLVQKLAPCGNLPTIWAGNFNMVMNPATG